MHRSSPASFNTRIPFLLLLALAPLALSAFPSCSSRKGACGDARVDQFSDSQKAEDATLVDEECDDGNTVDDDQCSNTCTLPKCGDGIVQAASGEQCEDADYGAADRCSPACDAAHVCKLQPTPACVEAPQKKDFVDTDGCTPKCQLDVCNDGYLYSGVEECDDGNNSNTDDCLVTCLNATCGDGFLRKGAEVSEECDDGNDINIDNCTSECKKPVCGDGYVWMGVEQCDDGNTSSDDACPASCKLPTCGDGFLDPSTEECDDGNLNDTDGCLSTCKKAKCGDGIVEEGVEECDDGNAQGGDYCDKACKKQCLGNNAGLSDGHCYMYFPGPLAWAQADCGIVGGHRVSITSAAENSFVQGLLPAGAGDPWIGLTDVPLGEWRWQEDAAGMVLDPTVITKWESGQPDMMPAPAHCAIMARASGLWRDEDCAETRGFVCEHDY